MKYSFIIIFGLATLFCFKNRDFKQLKTVEENTEKDNEVEILIQEILDLPKLQWIYHPEIADRLPVKLLENEYITKNLSLNKFGKPLLILTKAELENKKLKDYIVIEKLDFKKDTVKFYLTYDIEGVFAEGEFTKNQNKWTVLNYKVGEH